MSTTVHSELRFLRLGSLHKANHHLDRVWRLNWLAIPVEFALAIPPYFLWGNWTILLVISIGNLQATVSYGLRQRTGKSGPDVFWATRRTTKRKRLHERRWTQARHDPDWPWWITRSGVVCNGENGASNRDFVSLWCSCSALVLSFIKRVRFEAGHLVSLGRGWHWNATKCLDWWDETRR